MKFGVLNYFDLNILFSLPPILGRNQVEYTGAEMGKLTT